MNTNLVILNGSKTGQHFLIRKESVLTIGRSSSCGVQLDHKSVSAKHCHISCYGGVLTVEDSNSSNGTYVNGERVKKAVVKVGDIIQVGGIKFLIKNVSEKLSKTIRTKSHIMEEMGYARDSENVLYSKKQRDPTFIGNLSNIGFDNQAKKDLELLHNIGKLLQQHSNMSELMGQLLENILNALEVGRGCIFYQAKNDTDKLDSIFRSRPSPEREFSSDKFMISTAALEAALNDSTGTVSSNTLVDRRFQSDSTVRELNIHSIVCVPLQGKDGSLGAIYLDSLWRGTRFQQRDLDLLTAIGRQVGLGIERIQAEIALQLANEELEARVKERTAELSQANALLQQEVNERKRAAEALRKSKEKYRLIVENIPDVVWASEQPSTLNYISPNIYKMLGYTPQEILDSGTRLWLDNVHPQDIERVKQAYQRLFEENSTFDLEYQIQRKDGEWIWVHNRARRTYQQDNGIVCVDGVFSDITERKKVEKDLRESKTTLEETLDKLKLTQEQIIQQERLRALGQMASGIAHDFNNALSPISGFSELLMLPENLSDRRKSLEYLKMIHTSAQDAANIVRRLREFYRHREVGEVFKPVKLNNLVDEVISLTQPKWKDQALALGLTIHVTKETDPNIPPILGNESELREMMTNLIFNAVDSMSESGTIKLSTKLENNRVVFRIADTGCGMDEKVHMRCLEPFFSTKGERGTGLGLAIVFGIVQRHQGKINIETEIDKGTTFIFSFPSCKQFEPKVKAIKNELVLPKLKILLVDDELPMRNLLKDFLTYHGHEIEVASNGKEGLAKFREGEFDVIVTDMAMPEINGDQLAASIKKVAPDKPIILLTGFGDMMEAAGEKPECFDYILPKPIKLEEFKEILAKVI